MKKLARTWFIDLDGTIVLHNGYLYGKDILLPKSKEFMNSLENNDVVIITTGRSIEYKEKTENFLKENSIRYDYVLYGLPLGERIVINDEKPSGMKTAFSYNVKRNIGIEIFHTNESNNDE